MSLDLKYRSACCQAPIRMGKKKLKGTNRIIVIPCCVKCGKRDVRLVDNNTVRDSGSSQSIPYSNSFAPDEDEPFQDANDPRLEP